MKELSEKIRNILLQFRQEEIGNRLSQFSMAALISEVLKAIDEFKPKNEEGEK